MMHLFQRGGSFQTDLHAREATVAKSGNSQEIEFRPYVDGFPATSLSDAFKRMVLLHRTDSLSRHKPHPIL